VIYLLEFACTYFWWAILTLELILRNCKLGTYLEKAHHKKGCRSGSRCRPCVQMPVLEKKRKKEIARAYDNISLKILMVADFYSLRVVVQFLVTWSPEE
jgi:hypothetical protein